MTLEPPHDPDHVSSFLNIRVAACRRQPLGRRGPDRLARTLPAALLGAVDGGGVPAAGDHHGAGRRRATLLGRAVDAILGTHRQWQRLALTRTFFPDGPLMILDEPSAALNAKGEHELFARIGELFADRSVLVISHRLSTVRSVDPIYVLNEGYVVESGTHEKLLAAGGTYAELFTLQASRTSSASPVRARLA